MYDEKQPLIFNRLQRKQISKIFREIFAETRRNIKALRQEALEQDVDAVRMVKSFDNIKDVVNPTLEQKFEFLELVAPNWNSGR